MTTSTTTTTTSAETAAARWQSCGEYLYFHLAPQGAGEKERVAAEAALLEMGYTPEEIQWGYHYW
jgi:hypothetical protein